MSHMPNKYLFFRMYEKNIVSFQCFRYTLNMCIAHIYFPTGMVVGPSESRRAEPEVPNLERNYFRDPGAVSRSARCVSSGTF